MWAAGDRGVPRSEMWELGDRIVRRAGVLPGEDVLDVACGTGSAAIRAAQAGARVTGLDLTPGLFDAGRRSAAQARLDLRWVEGRADAMPFADGSFDAVLSAFGAMFAARHAAAAAELARVLRPGGRLALFNWCRWGSAGALLQTLSGYLPATAESPLLWGDERHVTALFAGTAIDLSLEHEIARAPLRRFAAVTEPLEHHASIIGPLVCLRRVAEREGRRSPALAGLERARGLTGERADGHYLVVLGRKRPSAERETRPPGRGLR